MFNCSNHDLELVSSPVTFSGAHAVLLSGFSQGLENVRLPSCLQQRNFGSTFDHGPVIMRRPVALSGPLTAIRPVSGSCGRAECQQRKLGYACNQVMDASRLGGSCFRSRDASQVVAASSSEALAFAVLKCVVLSFRRRTAALVLGATATRQSIVTTGPAAPGGAQLRPRHVIQWRICLYVRERASLCSVLPNGGPMGRTAWKLAFAAVRNGEGSGSHCQSR